MSLIDLAKERTQGIPWSLLLTVYALIAIGLINLYSATSAHVSSERFMTQVEWILAGTFIIFILGFVIDIKTVERLVFVGYAIIIALLFSVDFFGVIVNGSQRWVHIGPVRIQPSEPAKFVVLLATAKSLAMMRGYHTLSLFDLWRQIILIGIPFVLILINPDLGTAGVVALIAGTQILFVRVSWRSLLSVVVLGLTGALIAWNFVLYPYQKSRVLNFLNPMGDPLGAGYHSIQSMIAVGSGGLTGQGYQEGTQSQLSFLPERDTDFVFSVLAEEHGFIGTFLVCFLFAALILQCFQIGSRAKDSFCSLVALGVGAFFTYHLFINLGMVLGVFPVVGVPLSLISYGGSHMISALSAVGLLVGIERRRANSTGMAS